MSKPPNKQMQLTKRKPMSGRPAARANIACKEGVAVLVMEVTRASRRRPARDAARRLDGRDL